MSDHPSVCAAAAGARLVMQDVTVLETPSVCKQQQQQEQQQQSSTSSGSSTAAVWTEGHLLAALSDADVSRVVVTDDITLTRDFWQVGPLVCRKDTCWHVLWPCPHTSHTLLLNNILTPYIKHIAAHGCALCTFSIPFLKHTPPFGLSADPWAKATIPDSN
jgi:hypothetical protein